MRGVEISSKEYRSSLVKMSSISIESLFTAMISLQEKKRKKQILILSLKKFTYILKVNLLFLRVVNITPKLQIIIEFSALMRRRF